VIRTGNPRLVSYAALAALGLLGALVLRRPELAVIAAPFTVILAIGTRARDPGIEAVFAIDAERTLEDEAVDATVTVRTERAVDRLELLVDLPRGVEVVDGDEARSMRLRAGERRELDPAAEHRRELEQLLTRRAAPGEVEPYRIAHAHRDRHRIRTREVELAVADQARDLGDEERVAGGRIVDASAECRRDRKSVV